MTAHSTLTGTELHENKGVDAASDNIVATAVSNATVWRKVRDTSIDTSYIFNVNRAYLTVSIADVSTAEKVYLAVPFTGTLTKVTTVLQNAITIADSTVTVKNNSGASAGTLTIAFSGSAAGDVDTLTPVSNNTFTSGQVVSIETDGASTTAARLFVTLSFTITG
jgi:hypothetical protein